MSLKNTITDRPHSVNGLNLFISTLLKIVLLSLSIGIILRIVLLFNENTETGFAFIDWLRIYVLGAINDICVGVIASVFIWLDLIFVSDNKYKKPWGYIIWGLLLIGLAYVSFFNTIFDEYGSVVPIIIISLLLYKSISFTIRLFVPSIRKAWSFSVYTILIFLYVANFLLFVAVGEYLFWDEFGVRYNFIAVDYLIYTNEVVGNIIESYPIIPLFIALAAISGLITYLMVRKSRKYFNNTMTIGQKSILSISYFILTEIACFILNFNTQFQNSENTYSNELQANGSYKFVEAFKNSRLVYDDFYTLLPKEEAISIINKKYNSRGIRNQYIVQDSLPEIHKNIILITVESLSASFMEYFGNTENITPNLDNLANESLFFTNLFATGNRTVRGLEAVTLSRPPCAGESIVKQPNNSDLFSAAKVLKDRGYITQFLYGGDSYFDNMKTFFGGNGYQIIDKKNLDKSDVTFSNIWGVCDEDIFNKALKVFDEDAESNRPFLGHIMTISNHRPYTYPEDRIDIPSDSKSRAGGVKYSDYALGKFIERAKTKLWFKNTVFVILADHCASSAGKTNIPLEKYRIPALIYAPGFIKPRKEDRLISQIDIIPTLFGLLNFSYESRFFGKNIYSNDYEERAFIATYQNLGYLKNDTLTVLSPVMKVQQFKVLKVSDNKYDLTFISQTDSNLLKEAIANYQLSSYQ